MSRHLASFALIGVTGHRVGTRFVFKPEEIDAVHGNPYFKWRNDDARREYREWKQSQDKGHDDFAARHNKVAARLDQFLTEIIPQLYCGECDRYERDPVFLDVERCSECGELIEADA